MLPEKGSFRQWYHINDSPIILFLGRIHSAKGIDILLHAFRSIVQGRDARLVIAGQDDGYKAKLEELADRMDIPSRVLFTGHLDGVRKLAALVDADALVQPSRNEAGARPSLEAIMVGTPVIVSRDTGAGREIAKFDGGLLFKSGDAGELANAIQEIIEKPEEAIARTEKAREYIVENLSLDKGIVGYEKLYQEAVS
jgi:glycosyltransferase involved in cell wall biosynthesis